MDHFKALELSYWKNKTEKNKYKYSLINTLVLLKRFKENNEDDVSYIIKYVEDSINLLGGM